jgi:hypothetical protein
MNHPSFYRPYLTTTAAGFFACPEMAETSVKAEAKPHKKKVDGRVNLQKLAIELAQSKPFGLGITSAGISNYMALNARSNANLYELRKMSLFEENA